MTIDIAAILFVALLAVLGWFRGLVGQIAGLGALLLLWFTREAWEGPAVSILGHVLPAATGHPVLGRLVAFSVLLLALLLAVFLVERAVIRRVGPLRTGNEWLGAVLGGLKGAIYAVLAIWLVEAAVLWNQEPEEPAPSWLRESRAVRLLGPWNPVRLFSLKEIVQEAVVRAREAQDTATAAGEAATGSMADARRRLIEQAPPVRAIVRDVLQDRPWEKLGWRQLATDPRVKRVLADPTIRDLLFTGTEKAPQGERSGS